MVTFDAFKFRLCVMKGCAKYPRYPCDPNYSILHYTGISRLARLMRCSAKGISC